MNNDEFRYYNAMSDDKNVQHGELVKTRDSYRMMMDDPDVFCGDIRENYVYYGWKEQYKHVNFAIDLVDAIRLNDYERPITIKELIALLNKLVEQKLVPDDAELDMCDSMYWAWIEKSTPEDIEKLRAKKALYLKQNSEEERELYEQLKKKFEGTDNNTQKKDQ